MTNLRHGIPSPGAGWKPRASTWKNRVPLAGAIITKIDEAAQLGCVLSATIRHNLPSAWFSDGQRIPDDLHAAADRRLWLINQAVECLQASDPQVDERLLAERYGQVNVHHAQ
ncbi:MAG: hypothetical protein AAF417_14570 [Pseudomonadota bacterium]